MTSVADNATARTEERPPETGLLVYGVVAAETGIPDVPGLDEAVLHVVRHEQLAAVVSDYTLDRRSGRGREVRAFGAVLDALNAAGTVVPVRFGTVLPDEEAVVTELLAPRAEQLHASLDDLTGRSQFTVRAHYLEQVVLSEVVSENPEVADLRRATRELPEDAAYGERVRLGELVARAMEGKQAQDIDALLGPVLEHTTDHVLHPTAGLERLLEVAVLVDDARRDEFEASLESLAEAVHERIRVQLLGPTPPYDFVPDA